MYSGSIPTIGIATMSMTMQVEADMPVLSLRTPARIPPAIPPTSKNVDKLALASGL